MEADILFRIIAESKDVILGATGGIIAYLFEYIRAKKSHDSSFTFVLSSMLVHSSLGAFVGYSVGTFMVGDITGRNALVAFSGVTSYSILLLADNRFALWMVKKIGIDLGDNNEVNRVSGNVTKQAADDNVTDIS